MNIEIDKAQNIDACELAQIQKEAFKRLYLIYNDESSPYNKGEEEILRWLDMEKVKYWKILCDGQLCGGIAYYRKSEDEWYLARLFVHPDLQRGGIASAAINAAEKLLEGGKFFSLDFPIDQCANKRTYEKAGYEDTGERRVVNDKLTLAIYEKNAAPECVLARRKHIAYNIMCIKI